MDIWAADKLLLFIAFAIPGFISLKVYNALIPSPSKDTSQQLLDAVAYSCVNYALLFWPIYEIETSQTKNLYPSTYMAFYAGVLLVAPIIWACLLRWLRTTQIFQGVLPHPTEKPWDYVFGQRKAYWIIVTLKDGTQIAGRYDSASFTSNAPHPEQLYLQETWVLNDDGGLERPKQDTAGILILSNEISTIEFFNITNGDINDGKEPA